MYGHVHEECRKRTQQRKEWRAVVASQSNTAVNESEEGAEGDFQLATRHISRKPVYQATEGEPDDLLQINKYNALLEEGGIQECTAIKGNGEDFTTPHG